MAKELWQMAKDWLQGLGVVPDNSPALAGGARVYDLALALQDGTVLCNCMNKLVKGAIEQVHKNPDKQFLKMQNINSFLATCPKMGLKESDLFTADQLYYASDFQKVIACLSALSRSNSAKGAGLPGFPRDKSVKNTATDGGEDMYQSLEDLVGQSISFQESAAANASAAFDPDDDEDDEDIYGSIRNVVDQTVDHGAEDVYSDLLYQGTEDIYTTVSAPEDKRNCVLSELFETEKNYVEVLRTIIDKFQRSLQQSKLSKADNACIFSNVGELLQVHIEFFGKLQATMQSKTGRNISKPFEECVDKMRAYGLFCCEIPLAITKLKELAQKPALAKVLEQSKKESGQRFPLKDLLNVPMQRVLKYPLLIRELIKATPDSHPDKKRLLETANLVKGLAEHINTTKKNHDALINVINSVRKYKGPPLRDIAPLVKDGDVKVKEDSKKDKLKDMYVFLFQTGVVLCKTQGTAFQFKEFVSLSERMEVVDVPFWNLHKDEQAGKYTFAWCLKTGTKDLWFAAKSLATKKKWMNAMQGCLDELKESKGIRPEAQVRAAAPGGAPAKPTSSKKRAAAETPKSKKPPSAAAAPGPKGSYEQWVIPGKGAAAPQDDGADRSAKFAQSSGDEGWFGGKIQRPKAEKMLEGAPDGTFLVRESHTRPGDYSLSVQYDNNVKHIKINRHGNKYDLAPDAKAFPSIQELIEHFQTHSLNRHFPGMETTLAIPFKANVGKGNRGSLFGEQKAVGIGRARARFAYQAKSHDELSFERGTEIVVLSTDDQDPGWWKGQLPDGKSGMFPANYVQQL